MKKVLKWIGIILGAVLIVLILGFAGLSIYANVNYKTCETCLAAHGLIRKSAADFPPLDDGCASAILRIPGRQMKAFRQQSKRMRIRARGEISRRDFACG